MVVHELRANFESDLRLAALPPDVRKASGFPEVFTCCLFEATPRILEAEPPGRSKSGPAERHSLSAHHVAKPWTLTRSLPLAPDSTASQKTNQFARLFDHRHSSHAIALDQFICRVHVG